MNALNVLFKYWVAHWHRILSRFRCRSNTDLILFAWISHHTEILAVHSWCSCTNRVFSIPQNVSSLSFAIPDTEKAHSSEKTIRRKKLESDRRFCRHHAANCSRWRKLCSFNFRTCLILFGNVYCRLWFLNFLYCGVMCLEICLCSS